jgi:hypothetical protein
MPAKWPDYKYNLHSFEAHSTEEIDKELKNRNCDYRDIVSITWIGTLLDGHYQVFYGLRQY